MEDNQLNPTQCVEHSGQCVRLDHLERRICLMEKMGLKILIGIGLIFFGMVANIVMVYVKVHV